MKKGKSVFTIGILTVCMIFSAILTASANEAEHWATSQASKWNEYGVIKGAAGQLRLDDFITRGELAVILDNIMDYQTKAENNFTDLDEEFYTESILKANQAGSIYGFAGIVRPKDNITREEIAVLFCNAFHIAKSNQGNANFVDDAEISSWAKGYVNALSNQGYIVGRGGENNYFDPKGKITRAEVITIVDNLVKGYYNQAGIYSQNVTGNVVVNTSGVVLKDMDIAGNLIAAEGIGDGSLTLDNVKVSGKIILKGGGSNSIYFKGNTVVSTIEAAKIGKAMRIVVEESANIDTLLINENAGELILLGDIKNIQSNFSNKLSLIDANVMHLSVAGKDTIIHMNPTSKIEWMTLDGTKPSLTLQGVEGEIENLDVKASNSNLLIQGKVFNLTFLETAENSKIFVEKGCNIENMELNAEGIEVSGKGTIQNVYVNANGCQIDDSSILVNVFGMSVTTGKNQKVQSSGFSGGSSKISQGAPENLTTAAPTTLANENGKILGTTKMMEYKKEGEETYKDCQEGETTGLTPGKYLVRYRQRSGYYAGKTAAVTIEAYVELEQDAPSGLTSVPPTSISNNNGKILGTTKMMEYKKEGEETYKDCQEGETTGLTPGNYLIRYKANSKYAASMPVTVIIKKYVQPPVVVKTITIGNQSGNLESGTVGSATFNVATKNIANGKDVTVTEIDASGNSKQTQGLSIVATKITNNETTVKATIDSTVRAETYYFKVTCDGTVSNIGELVVKEPTIAKTIAIGTQSGNLESGIVGRTTFNAQFKNIADGEDVFATETDASGDSKSTQGLRIVATKTLNNTAIVTVTTDNTVKAGNYYFKVTCDGVVSNIATINVDKGPGKEIYVLSQNGKLTSGETGSAIFNIQSQNIADGEDVFVTETDAGGNSQSTQGLSIVATKTLNNTAIVTVTTDNTVGAGNYYFQVTCDGVESNIAKLVVAEPQEPKSILLGPQLGNLTSGIGNEAKIMMTTKNVTNGSEVRIIETDADGNAKAETAGLTITSTKVYENFATITVKTSDELPGGTYYFTVYCDGAMSSVSTVEVDE